MAKPSVNSDEPDSRNAFGMLSRVNGSSISANPTYRQQIQPTSRANRNVGAPADRIFSRRYRFWMRAVISRKASSTVRATKVPITEPRFRGISRVLMTLDPVSNSRNTPAANPAQAITLSSHRRISRHKGISRAR